MKHYVYVLRSKKDSSFYIGMSKNPEKRLEEHNKGYSKFTKGRRPYELINKEECSDRKSARVKEKYYKSGIGREILKDRFPPSSVGRAGGCQ